jgi:subtilisin family serine protease
MEKEYAVIVKRGISLQEVDAELTASTGAGPIPNRTVDIANPRLGSTRMTHWMLTDLEANELRNDARILAVEIPPDQRDDIKIGTRASQEGAFERTAVGQNTVNWGLRRCVDVNNNFNSITGSVSGNYNYALDGSGVDIVIQDSGLQVDHPEFMIAGAIDSEYNNGAIINLTGDGSNFFSREVTVNGVRIVAAGAVGGQTAVPDAFVEKVARMFELFTDVNGAGINEASQRTFIKTLSGDAGTYHAAVGPTLQRVARGAGSDYTPNFLTDSGIASYNLSPLFDSHVANDMVWYLNSTGDAPGDGDNDAQEVIEHVFHTLHMHGLDAVSLKMYSYISADWASGPLYAAMEEAYDAGKWDSSGYGGNAWKTDGDAFEVAAKEYLFLLNFGMFEYSSLWDGGSLSPEWTDDMRTQSGIQANNPLGYALHNTYIAPVISKPSLTTIRSIFQDGDVGDPTVAGASGYVVSTAGTSRVQQIDWYTASGLSGTQSANFYRDRDGHGTHCAGIAAGKTYGWAKGANVYAQKLAGLETLQGPDGTGIPAADAFDSIRLWHNAKTNGRPTVVNMSWGYLGEQAGNPTSGTYRGTPWTFNLADNILNLYGLPGAIYSGSARYPVQVSAVDAEIEDMIDAGIHICLAAGNDFYKADVVAGDDYNNTVVHNATTYSYHRPGSPYSNRAFFVGSIDNISNSGIDRPANYSKKGPAVNVWAPGSKILSTASNLNDTSYNSVTFTYPTDSNYSVMNIGGTSMASPQVAGLLALYLQSQPTISPDDLLNKVIGDSSAVISDTGLDNDYTADTASLMGSSNRLLYSRYGVANTSSITGSLLLSNFNLSIATT